MKELIIKCGAAGDVVRTTPLLRLIKSETWWVTSAPHIELLPGDWPSLTRIISIDEAHEKLKSQKFARVISLDDEIKPASLSRVVDAGTYIGSYADSTGVNYSSAAEPWFGMGILSHDGIEQANDRKWNNARSYQEILFNMLGENFLNEEYVLPEEYPEPNPKLIAIETRAGMRWPTKQWHDYERLADMLRSSGFEVRILKQRPSIIEYLRDIADCGHLICGDTLAMHLGLGLKINVTGIFTCTPPQEIYSYERMAKVVSPRIKEAFYVREYLPQVVNAITAEMVFDKFIQSIER